MILRAKRNMIQTEVADSFWKKIKGLSFSKKKRNMFFPFTVEKKWSFWTLGMKFPIYIVFINSKKKVVDIQYAKSNSLKLYRPKKPCLYVLETHKKPKIKINSKLNW